MRKPSRSLPALPRDCPVTCLVYPLPLSASTHRRGSANVRRDFFVFVSTPERTERQTAMYGGIRGTTSAFLQDRRDPTATREALRPGPCQERQQNVCVHARPPTPAAQLRLERRSAPSTAAPVFLLTHRTGPPRCALPCRAPSPRLIARFRQEYSPCSVRVLHELALSASHLSTSSALRSRIRRAPSEGRTCVLDNDLTAFKVATSRPAMPKVSQSFTAWATV